MHNANLYFPETRILGGRRCKCECEVGESNPQGISNLIIGRKFNDARLIYNNIRAVIINGKPQIVSQNFMPSRINVETNNNFITRIVGFY
jgi:hypothetical protein